MTDLDAIFKAYDVRGVVPEQFDERIARFKALLDQATDADLAAMLTREGLVRFRSEPGSAKGVVIDDAAGNPMWSVSVVIGTEDEVLAEDSTRLRSY